MSDDHTTSNSLTLRSLHQPDRQSSAQDLLLQAYDLCKTARRLLQEIKKGNCDEAQVLCERQGLDRDAFLKISPGSLVPAAAWARFVKTWYGEQILRLPNQAAINRQTDLIDRWLSRAEALAVFDTTVSRAQALECLDCAIDSLHFHPNSKQGDLRLKLITAYSQRGHLLRSFGDPKHLELAIAAFDKAIELASEDALPNTPREDDIDSLLHTYRALQSADVGSVDGPKEVRIKPRALKPLRKEACRT